MFGHDATRVGAGEAADRGAIVAGAEVIMGRVGGAVLVFRDHLAVHVDVANTPAGVVGIHHVIFGDHMSGEIVDEIDFPGAGGFFDAAAFGVVGIGAEGAGLRGSRCGLSSIPEIP